MLRISLSIFLRNVILLATHVMRRNVSRGVARVACGLVGCGGGLFEGMLEMR